MFSQQLLDIIACPACKAPLIPDTDRNLLLCRGCALGYPVKEGIPVLLNIEAVPLPDGCPEDEADDDA